MKNKLQEVSKTNFKEFEKQTSRSLENKLQEVSKTNCNNTEYNYTEFSENESYQYLSEQEKGKDRIQERNEYRQLIHDNIEYEILCQSYGTGRVEELVELMLDMQYVRQSHISRSMEKLCLHKWSRAVC